MKLVYTDEAINDLKRLREFIATHDPFAASRIAEELVSKISLLPDLPKIGTPVELAPVPDSVRDMFFGRYVVRYSLHTTTIIILRVWHELEGERSSQFPSDHVGFSVINRPHEGRLALMWPIRGELRDLYDGD